MDNIQKNLVVVDYQYDFVALDGNLTCGESAVSIEQNIISLINKYKNNNIFITYDTHYETDWNENDKSNEADIFPMHCVYNTKGHDLYGKINDTLVGIEHEKIYKNSFATEKLVKSILLKNDPNEPIEVQFCGVATNVCVFQNVILLYNYFVQNNVKFSIVIDKNTVASFNSELENQALEYLKSTLGIILK